MAHSRCYFAAVLDAWFDFIMCNFPWGHGDIHLMHTYFSFSLEENEKLVLTPFEKNLDIWRQLWRVLERSDLVYHFRLLDPI